MSGTLLDGYGKAAALAAPGHRLEYDPPAAMSRVKRWTCSACGRAVLYNGHFYGSATTEACDQT